MAFTRYQGKTKTEWLPVTASTTFSKGAIVSFASGYLIEATSSTAALSHVGVIKKAIAATDADYADSRLIEVRVPTERHATVRATTASLVTTDVGSEFDLSDSVTVNRGASSVDAVKLVKYISATEGVFMVKFNGAY